MEPNGMEDERFPNDGSEDEAVHCKWSLIVFALKSTSNVSPFDGVHIWSCLFFCVHNSLWPHIVSLLLPLTVLSILRVSIFAERERERERST